MLRTLSLCLLTAAPVAFAQEPQEPAEPVAPAGAPSQSAAAASAPADTSAADDAPFFEISLKAGARFPQVVNKLGTSFDGILKIGYAPIRGVRLQIFVDGGYAQPSLTTTGDDPRLGEAGSSWTSTLTLRDFTATLGLAYYFLPVTRRIVPWLGVGARVHFLRADVEGSANSPFGKYSETDTRFGFVANLGAGVRLGPGLVLAEVAFDYAPVDQRLTGQTNVGALALMLGYGIIL